MAIRPKLFPVPQKSLLCIWLCLSLRNSQYLVLLDILYSRWCLLNVVLSQDYFVFIFFLFHVNFRFFIFRNLLVQCSYTITWTAKCKIGLFRFSGNHWSDVLTLPYGEGVLPWSGGIFDGRNCEISPDVCVCVCVTGWWAWHEKVERWSSSCSSWNDAGLDGSC